MKNKHIPGPWHAWNKGGNGTDPYIWEVAGPMHTENHVVIADKLTEANARLIAAAPDLLEAAQAVWDAFTPGTILKPSEEAALIKLSNARRKAEGT